MINLPKLHYPILFKTGIANLTKMDDITDINKIIQKTKNENEPK